MKHPLVRNLTPRSREAVLGHFLALAPDDRHLRFGAALSDAALATYARTMDFRRDRVLAIAAARHGIAALAHVAIDGATAEVGLSVLPGFRGRGFGTTLFNAAASLAREQGCSRIVMHYLSENHAIQRIAQRAGMRVERLAAESDAYLALPPAAAGPTAAGKLSEPPCHPGPALLDMPGESG